MSRLIFNSPESVVREKLRRVDVACIDLDECLCPSFVQLIVGVGMFCEALVKPRLWKYLPQLSGGGLFITRWAAQEKFSKKEGSEALLMDAYAKAMRGVPLDWIRRHAGYLPRFFAANSAAFLRELSRRNIEVLVLSLSIHPILERIEERLGAGIRCFGNPIIAEKNTFIGWDQKECIMNGRDKLDRFKYFMQDLKRTTPLVIGHNYNEMPLVHYAREHGGVSIGTNPSAKVAHEFDVVVKGLNWRKLLSLSASPEKQ